MCFLQKNIFSFPYYVFFLAYLYAFFNAVHFVFLFISIDFVDLLNQVSFFFFLHFFSPCKIKSFLNNFKAQSAIKTNNKIKKMKKITKLKKAVITFCLFLSANALLAQTGNPYYSLPPNYWKVGTRIYPPLNQQATYGGYQGQTVYNDVDRGITYAGPHNMYTSNDNPLFFVANGIVYNNNGYLIDSLRTTSGLSSGTQVPAEGWMETCIVPRPGYCTQYYVFTAAFNDTGLCNYSGTNYYYKYSPFYALIDVAAANPNAPGQLGKNIISSVTTPYPGSKNSLAALNNLVMSSVTSNQYPRTGTPVYAASKVRSDGSRFLFMYDGVYFWVFKITSTGITCIQGYNANILTFASGYSDGLDGNGLGNSEMELYEDPTNNVYRIAVGTQNWSVTGDISVLDFNYSTGAYNSGSGTIIYVADCPGCLNNYNRVTRGVEFSPNGKWIYFTHVPNPLYPYSIEAIPCHNPHSTYDLNRKHGVLNDSTFQYSQI